jgi:ribose 1,5-bisphosphate isomerase
MKSFFSKRKKFNEIAKGIKEIKIQGARNIAKKALYAYHLIPTKRSKKKLLSLRPTEPMLMNVLDKMEKSSYEEILKHFDEAQDKINKKVFKLIKNKDVIFTHCHSTNVSNALIYSKKKGKKFEVYNTETRPLFQGRKTAKELRKAGIKVTMFVDSAAMIALTKKQGTKKADKVFFGADALLKNGVINKVGSGMFAQIAHDNKIPVYIIADSWKYSPKKIKLEERDFQEVWKKLPKKSKIKIENPAFEFVPNRLIKKVVSEV